MENGHKLLDENGVRELTKGIGDRIRLISDSTEKIEIGTTLTKTDGVLDVLVPVHERSLTQEEFDALPEEEKNHGMWIVKEENGSDLLDAFIDEYDTIVNGCNWHVRKWFNGYAELSGSKEYNNVAINNVSGQFFISNIFEYEDSNRVLHLTKKYQENYTTIPNSNAGLYWLASFVPNSFCLYAPASRSGVNFSINIYVTGRWK